MTTARQTNEETIKALLSTVTLKQDFTKMTAVALEAYIRRYYRAVLAGKSVNDTTWLKANVAIQQLAFITERSLDETWASLETR